MTAPGRELQLVSVREAARLLGIADNTLRQWICYGKFPYIRVGRRTVVAIRDLERFVEQNRVEPTVALVEGKHGN